jgi:hypothetical protein
LKVSKFICSSKRKHNYDSYLLCWVSWLTTNCVRFHDLSSSTILLNGLGAFVLFLMVSQPWIISFVFELAIEPEKKPSYSTFHNATICSMVG